MCGLRYTPLLPMGKILPEKQRAPPARLAIVR